MHAQVAVYTICVTGEETCNLQISTSPFFNQFETLAHFKRCIAKQLKHQNDLCLRLLTIEPSNYNPSLIEFVYDNGQVFLQPMSPDMEQIPATNPNQQEIRLRIRFHCNFTVHAQSVF